MWCWASSDGAQPHTHKRAETSEEINKAELKINQSLEMSRLRVTAVGPYVPHFIFEVIGNIVYTASGWRWIREDIKKMRRSHVCFAPFRVKGTSFYWSFYERE